MAESYCWQSQLPQEEGNWLWVAVWSCPCFCVRQSGIAWVVERPDGPLNAFEYRVDDDRLMALCWMGRSQPSVYDGKPDVDWWMRLEIPPVKED
jgi:hypothetical protein